MTTADVERLLHEHMALDVESLGPHAVARAMRERQAACGIVDPVRYWEYVRENERELQELVEAVIVPETWFFRDGEAFATLASEVAGRSSVRLLSVPCSTGEEPYSMAMALLDAGVAPERFSIDAIDISERALRRAQTGLYGNNSFRTADLAFRERYFEPCQAGYQLASSVCEMVRFKQGNLFAPEPLSAALYDVIFCRNVFIYFEREAQRQVLRRVAALLAPRGLLFVGPSETGLLLQAGFESARVPFAFAFRKGPVSVSSPVPVFKRPRQRTEPRPSSRAELRSAPAREAVARDPATLDDIVRIADQGRIQEATLACDDYLRQRGASARAYCLRGLLTEAAGQLDASLEYYRKALYLDPNHEETLLHLSLLLEKRGDAAAAERLRARALRAARGAGGR